MNEAAQPRNARGEPALTVEEYLGMEPRGRQQGNQPMELVDGVLTNLGTDTGPRGHTRCRVARTLMRTLPRFMDVHVRPALRLDRYTALIPDTVAFVEDENQQDQRTIRASETALVIEVQHESGPTPERLARYALAGIPEVWTVGTRAEGTTVHTMPSENGYQDSRVFEAGQSVRPRAAPEKPVRTGEFYPL